MTKLETFSTVRRTSAGVLALSPLLLPDEVLRDGIMPVTSLSAPIVIRIQNDPAEFGKDYEVQLYEITDRAIPRPIGAPHVVTDAEATDPTTIYQLTIPVTEFPALGESKTLDLDYRVVDPLGGGDAFSGTRIEIVLDREAPGGSAASEMPILEFTEDQLSGITLADVVGDRIEVTLPAWYGEDLGDKVTLWLGTSEALADGSYLPARPADEVTLPGGHGLVVEFLVTEMEALGNVRQYFGYNITDIAGNISTRSPVVGIDVLLTGAPGNFLAPIVPDFLDHGVVTQKDAAELVEVQIPQFDNPAVGDRIYVLWGNTRMPPYFLTAADIADPSIEPLATVLLPYANVIAEGSGVNKEVRYEVVRGTLVGGLSPLTLVDVNLSTPGPTPDPDPTTPVHENLLPLTLVSAGGANDRIPPADFGPTLNATATVPFRGVDGQQIWLPGDRVQISWGGTPVLPPTPITTANAGADITITIPGSIITDFGVGSVPVTYSVLRDIPPPPNVAEALSPVKAILVESTGLLPGDGVELPVAVFPEDKGTQLINRLPPSGLDGTPIRIPLTGVSNIAVGDTLTLRFVGRSGGVSIPPVGDPPRAEIPGTEVLITDHVLTPEEFTVGFFQIDLPYNPILRAICRNGSTTDYSFTNASGTTNAKQQFMRIVLDIPGQSGVCSISGN